MGILRTCLNCYVSFNQYSSDLNCTTFVSEVDISSSCVYVFFTDSIDYLSLVIVLNTNTLRAG